MDPITIGLTAASMGGSLLSGLGAAQSSAKQARLQQIADNEARRLNEEQQRMQREEGRRLGQEMLTVPEVVTVGPRETGGWIDVDAFMAAGERAGFNPVTWLQSGALSAYQRGWDSGYTQTTTGQNAEAAYKMMLPDMLVTQPGQVPQQHSMLSAIGGALSAGASTFGTSYRAGQSYDLQMARILAGTANQGMGLSGTNGLTTALQFGLGGLGALSGGSNARSGANAASGLSDIPYPTKWEPGDVSATNPYARAFIDSKVPDAETGEARYGEVGELLFGLRNIVNDSVRNFTGRALEDWGVAAGMNIGSYKKPEDTSWGPAFGRWWNSPGSLPNQKLPGFSGSVTPYMPFPGAAAY